MDFTKKLEDLFILFSFAGSGRQLRRRRWTYDGGEKSCWVDGWLNELRSERRGMRLEDWGGGMTTTGFGMVNAEMGLYDSFACFMP